MERLVEQCAEEQRDTRIANQRGGMRGGTTRYKPDASDVSHEHAST